MTTKEILSAAYAAIYGIEQTKSYDYNSQRAGDAVIDYTSFARESIEFNYDTDYFIMYTGTGCEGVWIEIILARRNVVKNDYDHPYVGCIKTLTEGRAAWRDMGMLAGEMTYMANQKALEFYYAERKRNEPATRCTWDEFAALIPD